MFYLHFLSLTWADFNYLVKKLTLCNKNMEICVEKGKKKKNRQWKIILKKV